MPFRLTLCLALMLVSTGFTYVEKHGPSAGNLKAGEVAYVDDGSCPHGKIAKITGGNHREGIPRKHECVSNK